jgi:Uma2 family endonuclease
MGTKTILSLEEFERLPDNGMRHELNKGELVEMPPPKSGHTRLANKIARILDGHAEPRGLGEALVEAGFLLSIDPATCRQPDVCFLSAGRTDQAPEDGYFQGAPDIAIEIVSPGNTATDLEEKIDQYLAAGGRAVWVVYPKLRRVHVHRADGTITALSGDQQLTAEDILPGLSIPVASLFV